jgi:tetratricopeptide (TPR) repeat protein
MANIQPRQPNAAASSYPPRLRALLLIAVVALLAAGAFRLFHGHAPPPLPPPVPAMDDTVAELPSPPLPPRPIDLNRLRALHAATLAVGPTAEVSARLQAAQIAQQIGDLFTTERLIKAALKQEPHSIPARRLLADLLQRSNRFAEAQQIALDLHAEQPHALEPFIALAEIADAQGRHDAVFEWLAKAHSEISPTVENLIALAHHYQDWDDFPHADATSAEALRLAPGDENAMLQRASILVQHGEAVESRRLLEDLVVRSPQNGYACRLLAVLLTNPTEPHQDFGRARALLEKAADLNPKDDAIYRVAAIVYRKLHLYRLAAQCYDALLKLDPASLDGRYGLGQVYALLGKADWSREQLALYAKLQARQRPIPVLDVAVHHHPNDPKPHTDKARYLESQGDLTEALAEYEKAVLLSSAANRERAMAEVRRCYTRLGWPPLQQGAP